MQIALGEVVISKAGRDAGRKFVVIGIVDEFNVALADGDLRRIEKPKKKKVKHLGLTGEIIEYLSEKLKNQQKLTNSEIRKALAGREDP